MAPPTMAPPPKASTMKIRELKAELASYGVCAVNLLEKSELVRAVDEARAAARKRGGKVSSSSPSTTTKQDQPQQPVGDEKRPKERRGDDIGSMSIKQLKRELAKCGICPSQFFEKRDMQEALRSAQQSSTGTSSGHAPPHHTAADADTCGSGNGQRNKSPVVAPSTAKDGIGMSKKSAKVPNGVPNLFSASLSESFGPNKQQPSTTTTTPSKAKKQRPPRRPTKVSDQYSWCRSEGASRDLKSSRNTKRHSKEEGAQPSRQFDGDMNMKRMPKSYFPVDTFDSGTAGGEPMGGSAGTGLAGDAAFPGTTQNDTHAYHNNHNVEANTFVPASAEKVQDQQYRSRSRAQGNGKNKDMERREFTRTNMSSNQSPSSVAPKSSFEQDARPEWLQM